jgi:hypothetical protein
MAWLLALLLQDALIQDLDSDDPVKREEATTKLIEMGKPAMPAVRKALKESASPEVRARAEQVLDRYVASQIPGAERTLKPLGCRDELEKFFPGYRFYLISLKDSPYAGAFLTPDNEVVEYALKENHKEKETALLKAVKKAKVIVKSREDAQKFGLLWLLLAYGTEDFKVQVTDHQFETRY